MTIKLITLLWAVSFFVFPASAQTKITGTILDNSGKALAFATVSLLRATDSVVTGSKLADTKGVFSIEVTVAGEYIIKASYTGYESVYSNRLQIDLTKNSVNSGELRFSQRMKSLHEILVVGKKAIVERKGDKYIMDVENSALSQGNSLQLLKMVPFVNVSPSKEVTLQGNRTLIMIDNRPVANVALQDVLQSLPAGDIVRIEFITEPSARYDAAYGGVINIVTKKNQTTGLTGNIRSDVSMGKYGILITGGRLTYKHNDLTAYGSVSYQKYNEWYEERGLRNLTFSNEKALLADSTTRLYRSDIYTLQTGFDYALSKNQSIGAEINGSLRHIPGSFSTTTGFSKPGMSIDSVLHTPGDFLNNGSVVNYSTSYLLKTDSGKGTLIALVTYTPFRRTIHQNFQPYLQDDGKDTLKYEPFYRTINKANVDIIIAQADYTHVLPHEWKLETGLKYQYSSTSNEVLKEDMLNGYYTTDSLNSSNIKLHEEIMAGYGLLSKKWKHYFVQTGLRVENTGAIAKNYFSKHYTDLFPNFLAQYSFNNNYKFSIGYRRQISRPPYQEVLPYTIIFDQYSYAQGNPLLNSGYTHLFTVTGSLKKAELSFNYKIIDGAFLRLPSRQDTNKVTYYSLQNIKRSYNYNFNIFFPLILTAWWQTSNSATAGYSTAEGNVLGEAFHLSQFTYNFKTNHIFRITENIRLELNYYYASPTISGLIKVEAYNNMDAGITIKAFKGRAQLRMGGEEIFKRNVYKNSQEFGTFTRLGTTSSDSRRVNIGFTWFFGKTKITTPQKKLGNEDAIQRAK